MKRATQNIIMIFISTLNFNPRPREEGDGRRFGCCFRSHISIHALVKRATNIIIFVHNLGFISIHALVKRATVEVLHRESKSGNFNPRPREEGDRRPAGNSILRHYFNPRPREEGDVTGVATDTVIDTISIHALVKRATQYCTPRNISNRFQSTPS